MTDFASLRESVADLQAVIQPDEPIPDGNSVGVSGETTSSEISREISIGNSSSETSAKVDENAKIFHVITADQYHGRVAKVEEYTLPEGMTEEFLQEVSALIKASKANTIQYIQYYRDVYSSLAEFIAGEEVHDDSEMVQFGRLIFSS